MNKEETESVRLSAEHLEKVSGGMGEEPGNFFGDICPCHSDGKHVYSIREPKLTLRLILLKCECGATIAKPM